MAQHSNLENQIFGKLIVLEYIGKSKWKCQCECGNITEVKTAALTTGKTKSCGCLRGKNTIKNTRNYGPKQNLIGQTFGYLTPLEYIKGGKWKCQCKCGNIIIVDTRNLNSGHTKSCGCYNKEINSQNNTVDMLEFENQYFKVLERADSDKEGVARWKCLCKNCNNVFITKGVLLRNNAIKSCGCIQSWNERKIIELFNQHNIEYATQYTFPDLKGQYKPLRFDFAVFRNGKLHHLIEYNGKQHYEKSEGAWGESFDLLQEYDQKKIQYCKDNNIELRIIKYNQEYDLKDLI